MAQDTTSRRRGRPPGPLSPEYQEVVALYGTLRPAEIAARLGRSRAWVNSAVQYLRSIGAIAKDVHVPRGPAPRPVEVLSLELDLELAAAVDRARGAAPREAWALEQLRRATRGR